MSETQHKRASSRVAHRHEVGHLAKDRGISRAQAESIIRRAGGNRQLADALCTLIKKQVLAA